MSKERKRSNKSQPQGQEAPAATAAALDMNEGDIRDAVLNLIQNDQDIMRTIMESVTQAIVGKLTKDQKFMGGISERITKKIMETDVLHDVKQEIYEACAIDNKRIDDNLKAMQQRLNDYEKCNRALRDTLDAQEQYSRRNCLLLHGVSEAKVNTTDAVLDICNNKLGLTLSRDCIDRSHRLGREPSAAKPRPIILKLCSYETRRSIFTKKSKLKGQKLVITENLTKTRAELLTRARAMEVVKAAWTIDGRIICLLEGERKVTIQTEQDLRERLQG